MHEFIAVARSGLWAPGRIETTALGVGVRVKEAGGGERGEICPTYFDVIFTNAPWFV